MLVFSVELSDAVVAVRARTRSGVPAGCTGCGQLSAWCHSRYVRRLADVTVGGRPLRIDLSVRRLYCENATCPKKTFAEQVPGLTVRYQRRTPQLQRLVEGVGVLLAGRGGARMLRILNIALSRCTVLSQLMRVPLPPLETPRVLGVDDFALYGGTYGTLLVDATTRLPLTLWEGRDAEQLSQWLREHPGVEVVCRDGSLIYRQGITAGAPDAVQVKATASISGRGSPAVSRTSPPPTAVACPQHCPRSVQAILHRSRRLPKTPRRTPGPGGMPEGCSRPCTL
ncbi:transposase family protein [Streptomyces sp.]|uniref:transposase family protein n=1 Tax=Streptomyces sp. TaxID=1931 RepID=UPI002D77E4D2|nr:transposase family protein [Streptomyces sp.]HET6352882.1 transposase family protein [Streptomyces sp.]